MSVTKKQLIKLILRFLVAISLLAWVFTQINFHQLTTAIKGAKWQFFIANCILGLLYYWINSIKMKLILKKQDCDVSIGILFETSSIATLYSLVMPGLLSSAVKWYLLKKSTGKGTNVFSGMIYNQFTEIMSTTIFGLAALIITNPTKLLLPKVENQYLLPIVCGFMLVGIILICALLLNRRTGWTVIKILAWMLKPFPERVRKKGGEILIQITALQFVGWQFHSIIILITLATTFIGSVVAFIFCAKGANINISVGVLVWLSAVIGILSRIPISVSNLGIREVTLIQFLAFYKISASSALLMSMISFSGTIFVAIMGAFFQIHWLLREKN